MEKKTKKNVVKSASSDKNELIEIKEEVQEVKDMLLKPDNNFAIINIYLGNIINKLDRLINPSVELELKCEEFKGISEGSIEKR